MRLSVLIVEREVVDEIAERRSWLVRAIQYGVGLRQNRHVVTLKRAVF
jgi:hypothetical protein